MGLLGDLLTRNIQYEITDTDTGTTQAYEIVTGTGAFASWDLSGSAYRGGMGLPGAWRASVLLSDLLGGLPWHAYRERGGRPPELITPTPPLLDQPAPPEVRVNTMSSAALDLIWHGNAIALIASRNRAGWPTALSPQPAGAVYVRRVAKNDPLPLPVGTIVYEIGGKWYHSDDVWHVKGPCEPGALRGMGVLEAHLNGALTLGQTLAENAQGVGSSGVPTLKIKSLNPDLTAAEAAALKAKAIESQRIRSPMVLNPSTDVEPISWNPTETQLIEARKLSLVEIALIFGLDPSWLGAAQSSRVYSNIEQEAINLIKFSLSGHLARFEQTFSAHLPMGTWAKANLDAVLRADTLTRYQAHQIGITAGFLTDDEARALEDMPPLTDEQRELMKPPEPTPAAGGGANA